MFQINRDLRSSLTDKEWRTLVGNEDAGENPMTLNLKVNSRHEYFMNM